MHELGIVFHIAKKVESIAVENHVNHVAKVVLEIGEVSTVVPSYLEDCWKWKCTKSEILKDCALEIEMIPAVTFCEDCEKTYGTVEHGKTCPYCGSRLKRNGKKPHRTFWDCKCCQQRLGPIPDDTLLQVVTERFLAVCLNPHMVEPAKKSAESLSIQAARLTNEINQAMNQREVDPNELLPLILECAAEKYKTCSIKEADHLTITLKALFQAHSNDKILDRELFERAVKQVILHPDASVQLRLLNDIVV